MSATDAALADVVEVADAFVDADANAAERDAATAFADAAFPREFADATVEAAAREAAAAFAVPAVEPAAFVDDVLFALAAATAEPTADASVDAVVTAAARDAAAAFAVPAVEPVAFVDDVLFAFAAATAEPTAEEVEAADASADEDACDAVREAATAFAVAAADAVEDRSPVAAATAAAFARESAPADEDAFTVQLPVKTITVDEGEVIRSRTKRPPPPTRGSEEGVPVAVATCSIRPRA